MDGFVGLGPQGLESRRGNAACGSVERERDRKRERRMSECCVEGPPHRTGWVPAGQGLGCVEGSYHVGPPSVLQSDAHALGETTARQPTQKRGEGQGQTCAWGCVGCLWCVRGLCGQDGGARAPRVCVATDCNRHSVPTNGFDMFFVLPFLPSFFFALRPHPHCTRARHSLLHVQCRALRKLPHALVPNQSS